ncbi:MAG: flagellar motor protein MotB [Persicimonas sp.]
MTEPHPHSSAGGAGGHRSGNRSRFGHQWISFDASSNRFGWIVSYADIMTIILTFFVLLLSIATITQNKFDMLVESFTGRKIGNLQEVKEEIDEVVEFQALAGQISTRIDEDGLKVEFANALLFDSGEATLHDQAAEVLEPIGQHLVEDLEPHYGVTIEGYTDDVPIANGRFNSNWELASSRAIDVMKRLRQAGMDSERMSIQGFADTRSATGVDLRDPEQVEELSAEELEQIRAANRRVVLRIHPLARNMRANPDEKTPRVEIDTPPMPKDFAPEHSEREHTEREHTEREQQE